MPSEAESFIIVSMINGYRVYKDAWSSFKRCTITDMKEVENDLQSGRHPASAKPAEIYTLRNTCKDVG